MSRPPRRRGFVLVMSLAILSVAALSLVGIARRSLALASQVTITQETLQRRWGLITLERALLAQADALLESAAPAYEGEGVRWPMPARIEAEFVWGGLEFQVCLADEDAKGNLNALYRRGHQFAERAAAQALREGMASGLSLALAPTSPQSGARARPFPSWGQIYEFNGGASADPEVELERALRWVTCWGSGRLNLKRATNEVVALVLGAEFGEGVARSVLAARQRSDCNLDVIQQVAELNTRQQSRFRQLASDQSRSYSLWASVSNGKRRWTQLVVEEERDAQQGRVRFVW